MPPCIKKNVHRCDQCNKGPLEMFYYRVKSSPFFKYYCSVHVPKKTELNAIVDVHNRPLDSIENYRRREDA